MSHRIRHLGAAALIAPLAAIAVAAPASADDHQNGTMIYTETNAASGNTILAFRATGGTLTNVGSYATGGLGAGTGLGSQGAVVVAGHRLLAVNAGSDQLSLFDIEDDGALTLTDVESSGGRRPISVTVDGKSVYVVNAGDRTVSGFQIRNDSLVAIPGSTQSLPGNGAAQISFDRTGKRLIVTEKATSTIDVLPVRNGVAGPAVSNLSTGVTPFGFAVDRRNHVIVSNAAGGAAGASSLSSYDVSGKTGLTSISPAVATTQTAACWVALTEDGQTAFMTNTGSGSISSYAIGRDGTLSLAQAVAASPGAGPVDLAVEDDELFTLASGAHMITAHHIDDDGSLVADGQVTVPVGVVGLATA